MDLRSESGEVLGAPLVVADTGIGHPYAFHLEDYRRVDVFSNPLRSRNGDDNEETLANIARVAGEYGLTIFLHDTAPTMEENRAKLAKIATKKSLFAYRTGDGALNEMLAATRALGLQNPILTVPEGWKNDIAHQLLHGRFLEHPEHAMVKSDVRPLRPLRVRIEDETGETENDVYAYLSVGVSSQVAVDVSDPDYRKLWVHRLPGGRKAAERFVAARDFARAIPFQITEAGGEPIEVIDDIASLGGLMAGSFKLNADLFKPGFNRVTARNRRQGILALGALSMGWPVGQRIEPGEPIELHIEAPGKDAKRHLYIQMEGEGRRIIGHTVLTITAANSTVNVLTTRGYNGVFQPKHRREHPLSRFAGSLTDFVMGPSGILTPHEAQDTPETRD